MPDIHSLNKEQQEAVTHETGPLLIIAGAGTGKTTVVTKRIEHLILEKKIPPSNILALTFTDKAAQEMESRIDEILPYGYSTLWIETFHAFCDRILRQHAIHIGLSGSFTLMAEAECLLFMRKHLFDFTLSYFRPYGNPTKFLQGMLAHFSRLRDDDITPEQYLAYAKRIENDDSIENDEKQKTKELAHTFQMYSELKAKESVMDYSDLISNTLKLFRLRPSILKQYQDQFQFVFVDEFQDTNFAQNELAILLAGQRKNITVVGDDDQSIYKWRGAAIANMMQFRSHFPGSKIIALTKNYRSTQTILDAAYTLIQHNNPDRLEIKEKIDKKLLGMRGVKGAPISFFYEARGEDEAEAVAKEIQKVVMKTQRPYNDFAILVRANDHALPFKRALDRLHIPFQFLGPDHLYHQEEIKDLIAYLHVLANFEDTASLYRLMTMPIFAISARDISALLNYSKQSNISLFETMENVEETMLTKDGKEKISHLTTMLKNHLEMVPHESAGQILYQFFEDSGLLTHYLDPGSLKTENEAQNIAKFFSKLQTYSHNKKDISVFAIVDWIDLAMELGESPLAAEIDWTRNNAVNILTIHSSKGLEFPYVFVVNLVTQRFPSRDRKEQIPLPPDIIRESLPEGDEGIQEERRLFYVAITRAKEKLYLTSARFYNDGKRERKLSPFITETLGENTINQIIKKHHAITDAQQLSLLDIFNANVIEEQLPAQEIKTPIDITYISYSQLQTYLTCPLHYKLRYILHMPSHHSPALSYGVSIHGAMRDFFQLIKQQGSATVDDMLSFLKTNWIPAGYTSKQHEEQTYDQAIRMVTRVALENSKSIPPVASVEMPFSFMIGKLKISGRIDRIDKLPDEKIEIIDYKTGTKILTEKKAKEDLQLSLYGIAATEVNDPLLRKNPEDVLLTLHYLEDNIKITTTRTKEQLEEAKQYIVQKVDEISQSDFACSGANACKTCEYSMLCNRSTG